MTTANISGAGALVSIGRAVFASALAACAMSGAAGAQQVRVSVEQVPCLLAENNGVVRAKVENNQADTEVRLYFRRLHEEVEDFYYVKMLPQGNGEYWGVFPKPAKEVLERRELKRVSEQLRERWARWWRQKEVLEDRDPNDDLDQELIRERAQVGRLEPRNWMETMSDEELEIWLDELEYEPSEYYAAVYDGFGQRLGASGVRVTQVRTDCETNLTASEAGLAENLTIGETASWQQGEEVFHWLCDGIVSRINLLGIWRADDICRACVVAWWKRPEILLPIAAGTTTTGVLFDDDDPPPVSPSRP